MENKKNLTKSITVVAVVFIILAVAMVGAASAKSLYVNKDINANSPISAYDIQPAPTYLVWQQTSAPTRYGGAGLGIDTDSATLFVSFEGSGMFDIVDATTLTVLGQVTAPGASNLAGIVVDQDKQKVYTNNRGAKSIYIYSWDATTKTLTLDVTQTLSGVSSAYGIALDEVNDLLYVGDRTKTVKIFNTGDWSSAGSFSVSQDAMGIAVDAVNGFVYTGNAYPPFGSLGLLSKYDLNTNTETTVNIRTLPGGVTSDNVVGLAVDQNTSLLYVTTGNQGTGGSDRILVFDSNLNLLHSTGYIGNPTGICVPGREISYNPLNLSKVDDVSTCVNPGANIDYTICYDNAQNPNPVSNVVINDLLPLETSFVSATGGGTYNLGTHTVTWNIGPLAAGAPQQCVHLVVTVKPGTAPGTKLDDACTINATEPGTGPTTVHEYTDVCHVGVTVESALASGTPHDTFMIGDPVYAIGSGYTPGATYTLYVMNDQTWTGGESLIGAITTASVTIDGSGNIPATQIWASAVQGLYDIVVDVDGSVTYSTGDAIDGDINVGFEAIPEFSTIAIPVASILGLLFFFNYRKRKEE